MLLIAYQGIYDGTNFEQIDVPAQITRAQRAGFSTMVDAWRVNGQMYLGAFQPITPVTDQYLQGNRFWINVMNVELQEWIVTQKPALYPNYFWYDVNNVPDYVTTSSGKLWTFGNEPINNSSIIFIPEREDKGLLSTVKLRCYGICSSYVTLIKRMRNEGRWYL